MRGEGEGGGGGRIIALKGHRIPGSFDFVLLGGGGGDYVYL